MNKPLNPALVDEQVLRALLARLRLAGQDVPSPSLRGVGWVAAHRLWRVQLAAACSGGQHYFSPRDYGGVEAALIQAQLFRDERLERDSVELHEPHARLHMTRRRRERGITLPMSRQLDARARPVVRGWWMETDASGRPRQRVVSRSIGLRTAHEAWREVEQVVRERVAREAAKARARLQAAARAASTLQDSHSRSSSA